ncbi:MAG TPA: 3-methyl-2-oxobutanoate hydroxymethyltransferase [Candidatus Acidoferrales bacterium]
MSVAPRSGDRKVTVPEILARKALSQDTFRTTPKIVCLTAYDYPSAQILDASGIDILLVGDTLGMVVLGYESTVPVTIEEILHHLRAVRRGTRRALLVGDMPFGTYHVSIEDSVRAAFRLVKEGGAEAVKLEGGERHFELIHRLVDSGIPVMGHIGMTPQSVNALGGFKVQGRSAQAAEQLLRDAHAIEAAGAFAVVLECVPRELAARITEKLRIPTIGIGAGPDCDGQILVFHDLLGLTPGHVPKFARQYADLSSVISQAVTSYCDDVRQGSFPSDAESYHAPGAVPAEATTRTLR